MPNNSSKRQTRSRSRQPSVKLYSAKSTMERVRVLPPTEQRSVMSLIRLLLGLAEQNRRSPRDGV